MRITVEAAGGEADRTDRLTAPYGSAEALARAASSGCAHPRATDDQAAARALRGGAEWRETLTILSPDVFADLTPRRVELLETLAGGDARSVVSLAAAVRRNYKNVYEDLRALERWGLVDLRRHGREVAAHTMVREVRLLLTKTTTASP